MRQFKNLARTLVGIGLAGASALALSACASYSAHDPLDFGTRLAADLDGANEVPKLGDPDGSGDFVAALNAEGRMCYEMEARGTDLITAAHMHEGAAGVAGGVAAPLITPQLGQRANACTEIDAGLAQRILDNPGGFYVNLHNAEYPAGAIRGQLRIVE